MMRKRMRGTGQQWEIGNVRGGTVEEKIGYNDEKQQTKKTPNPKRREP